MKRSSLLVLLVVLAGNLPAERTAVPPSSPDSWLSFSLTPDMAFPVGPMSASGSDRGFGAGVGATLSCQYGFLPSLYVGADLGYSYAEYGESSRNPVIPISIFQAGLRAGIQLSILPTAGIRGFGSAGYSYGVLGHNAGRGGTPYVGAGAELFWAFIPALSLTAGARYRSFVDLYSDIPVTVGISYILPVSQNALKRATPHVVSVKSDSSLAKKLAQSLTPTEPALLSLSNHISSSVKPYYDRALDKNLQSAIAIHQALRLLDVAYVSSPSETNASKGSVKSPLQTLRDRYGNSSDLSVLYISLLESSGAETAVITVPGRVYVALALASGEEEARKTSSYSDEVLFREGKAWLPVEVTECQGSFLAAWQAGVKEWRKAGKQAHLYPLLSAGDVRQQTSSAGRGSPPRLPDKERVAKGFQEELWRLVEPDVHDPESGEEEK